jgi:hypothetical protein
VGKLVVLLGLYAAAVLVFNIPVTGIWVRAHTS